MKTRFWFYGLLLRLAGSTLPTLGFILAGSMRDGEKSNPLFYPANLIKQTIYIVQLPSHVQLFATP